MIIAIILLIAVLLIVIWGISTVNGFKKKEIRVQEGLSGVEVALTKRYDMLTKLLDTAETVHRDTRTRCLPRSLSCGAA